ncbi:hypothetical protein BDF19DRAFT_272256 [Syncephalis fuscata]|nr:hypothetical protein BDF19DRAFT_272256 [Syncephalis fuscata]
MDFQRQRHMQRQFPWSVGALLTPPPIEDGGYLGDISPSFTIFRVLSNFLNDRYDTTCNNTLSSISRPIDVPSAIVQVPFAFASRTVTDPVLFRRHQHVLMNTLAESRKAHALQLADNENRRGACTIADTEYDAFLTDFWKSSVVELSKSIEHDFGHWLCIKYS